MTRPIRKRLRALQLGLLLLPFGALQLAGQPVSDEAPAETKYDDDTLLFSLGFVMASQIDLQIGLTDRELELVLEGIRAQATGTPQFEDYNDRVSAVRDVFMARKAAYQEKVSQTNAAIGAEALAQLKAEKQLLETESGLLYEIIDPGNQEIKPVLEDSVMISFDATYIDSRPFDVAENTTIRIRAKPQSLPGLIEGLQLLGEGGRAILYMPGDLAFGDRPPTGANVEPGEALIFDVTLVRVMKAPLKTSAPPTTGAPTMPTNRPPMTPPPGPPPGPPPTLPPNLKPPTAPPAGAQ